MHDLSVSVIATAAIRPHTYMALLVNDSDKTVRPTTHLFLIEDDADQTLTSLIVSVDALFEHFASTADGKLYWSGYAGYLITTDPEFVSETPEVSEVIMYQSEQANALNAEWYLHRICSEDIVLIGQIDNTVFFFSQSGQVIAYTPEKGTKTFVIGIGALSFCAKSINDIYVGTERGDVWHFDGVQWLQLPFVLSGVPRGNISAITHGQDGQVFVLSRNGFIACKASEGDFEIIRAPSLHYNGADWIDNRLFITAREGLYEARLSHKRLDLTLLKNTFAPLSLKASFGELIMTSATPRQSAYFVIAKPELGVKQLISCTAMSIDYKVEN